MKYRQMMALMTSVAMAVSLAACGGQPTENASQQAVSEGSDTAQSTTAAEQPAGDTTLRVAWWGSQARNDATVQVTEMYHELFPNVSFETEFADYGGYFEKLATQVAGNSVPDVIQMDRGYLMQYVNKNQLEDLTPYIESGLLDVSNIPEQSLNTGKVGDGLYALVLGVNVPSLFYDAAVVEEAGVTITNDMSMEDFIDACRTIYEKTGVQTDLDYGMDATYLNLYTRGKGGHLINDEGTALGIDETTLTDFFSLYSNGLAEGYMLSPEVYTELEVNAVEQNPMVLGKSWCTILFSNQLSAITTAAGRDVGIASVPASDVKALQYIKPSQFFSISANSANKEEAVKFINWFINDNAPNEVLLGERGVPANSEVADHISPMMSEANQESIAFVEQVSANCSDIDAPSPEGMSEIDALTNEMVEAVCYGTMTPQEAAQEFMSRSNEILSQNQ